MMGTRLLRLGKRARWGIGDQALSSLTNFALGLLVAREVAPADFGAFSIAFAGYTVALLVSRAVCTEPLVVRYSDVPDSAWRSGVSRSAGAAIVSAVVGGSLSAVLGLLTGGVLGRALILLGLLLPGLLLQDAWRYAFFARHDGRSAFLNDLVWALILFPLLIALIATDNADIDGLMLAWGGAATVAAGFGVVQSGVRPRPGRVISWLKDQRDLAPRYLGEFVALSGTNALVTFGVGSIAGLTAAGSLRAADILLGPIAVIQVGINLVAVPEGVRALKTSVDRLRYTCLLISACVGGAAALLGLVLVLIPSDAGRLLLGATWDNAMPVILPFALSRSASGVASGAAAGLRSLAAARRSLRARLVAAPLSLAGGLGGAIAGGARGAAIGLAITSWLSVFVWWTQFRRGLLEYSKPLVEDPTVGESLIHEDPTGGAL